MMVNNISPMNNQQGVNFKGRALRVGQTKSDSVCELFDEMILSNIRKGLDQVPLNVTRGANDEGECVSAYAVKKDRTSGIYLYLKRGLLEITEEKDSRTFLPDTITTWRIEETDKMAKSFLYDDVMTQLKLRFGIE